MPDFGLESINILLAEMYANIRLFFLLNTGQNAINSLLLIWDIPFFRGCIDTFVSKLVEGLVKLF